MTSPRRRREKAGDEIDDGALAGAVGADQAEDLALGDAQIDAVDGLDAAEVLAEVDELKHRTRLSIWRQAPHRRCRIAEHRAAANSVGGRAQAGGAPGIEQAAGAEVHGEDDERAEQQVAPVAQEAQALDQEALDESHGGHRAEHAGEAAEDRVGDGEGGDQHVEIALLDVRGVVRVDAAGDAGDEAAGGHGRDLDGGGLMPALWAAVSSSPTARSTAPARERSIHHSAAMTAATTSQMNTITWKVVQPFSGK